MSEVLSECIVDIGTVAHSIRMNTAHLRPHVFVLVSVCLAVDCFSLFGFFILLGNRHPAPK